MLGSMVSKSLVMLKSGDIRVQTMGINILLALSRTRKSIFCLRVCNH